VLAKPYRLTSSEHFRRLHREGRSWANSRFVLIAAENTQEHARFGFSVSRRIGTAVVRNRIKRLLREVVFRHLSAIRPGNDYLVIVRRTPSSLDYASTERALLELFERSGIRQNTSG